MDMDKTIEDIRRMYESLRPFMNERMKRLWAATEARALGRGGISKVAQATGMSRTTVRAGLHELEEHGRATSVARLGADRSRSAGGGRKRRVKHDPELPQALEALVEPGTRGDPQCPLRWTCKSTQKLAEELSARGHLVSARTVAMLLHQAGYSLQSTRKTLEGTSHPDRNEQFEHISGQVRQMQERGQPVISVDTKKKELVGAFRNAGREWQPKGQPEKVAGHDFPDEALGKAIPYGIYDVTTNTGWVSVGIDHDTPAFAAEAVRRWWRSVGQQVYPQASELLVTADGGGSNGYRSRAWKVELQHLADETGLAIHVCHLPPGTSKWNKIEHRMFCHITQNWRGRPLVSHEAIVSLIGSTTTSTGLRVRAQLDTRAYPIGIKVSADELAQVHVAPDDFHGEWNYTINPQRS
jgi:transposase